MPAGDGGGNDLDLSAMEDEFIRRALDRTDGNRTEAARLLGISRRTLQRKLKEMPEAESRKLD
jgi:two-component system response regulator AtoC